MDTFAKHVLDEKNRILLPQRFRKLLKWQIGSTLTAIPSQDGKTVTLKKGVNTIGVAIDSHGRITLPNLVLDATQWSENDTLNVSLNTNNDSIALELKQKGNEPSVEYMGFISCGSGIAPEPW